jgi:hypothetical protein
MVKRSIKFIVMTAAICAITFIAQYSFQNAAKAFGSAHAHAQIVPIPGQ